MANEKADEKLLESLQRERTILDSAHEAFICIDSAGVVTDWNNAATTTFGWPAHEALGRDLADLIVPERYRQMHRAGLARYLATGEAPFLNTRVELFALRRNGAEFPIEMTVSEIAFAGQPHFACFLHDIAERRQADELDRKFRLLVQSVHDYAIFMLDGHGVVTTWNIGARAIKGYEEREIVGKSMSVFYVPDDIAAGKPERALEAAREHGRVEVEGWRVRKDGSVFWANVIITALRDGNGILQGFAKVTRDMTQRRRLEALEASSRRMNEFLALLGHELRNPLAPIRNAVSILKVKPTDEPEVIRSRNILDRQLAHLTRLVDDLLEAGRIMTGKIQLATRRLPVAEAVQVGIEVSQPLIDAKDQTLIVHTPVTPLHVMGDTTRLSQVVHNLLDNASKFSSPGSVINIDMFEDRHFVGIRVSDSGRGIRASALQSVFDLFVQEKPPGEQADEGGLGIGLTLARSIVELHGGHIEVASRGPGLGSVFTVWLPLAYPRTDDERQAGKPPPPRVAGTLKVLVVDDNRDSADSMALLLEILGHDSRATYDGAHAIECARQFNPDAILLDLSMPEMTGFEALPRLRAALEPAQVTVAAMTGLGTDEDRQRTRAAGFDAHLTKPVDLPELGALLDAACRPDGRPGLTRP